MRKILPRKNGVYGKEAMKEYQVNSKNRIQLKKFDTDDTSFAKDGDKAAKKELRDLRKKLIKLQQLLYAENKHKVLIILQALDSGGKDGTIRAYSRA
jgi:polyphosphate kinase 2 (PPK2 family)